ncbi:MAG: lipoprotein insertase outer membrane protein LolB [Pseudomonadales bacterium]|nr:lipoprotein insertase outer membrane protein LolB [Pseudomonadales bacterium]
MSVSIACLTGCMHLANHSPTTPAKAHHAMPSYWQISGKLALQMPDQNQPTKLQSHVLRFTWQQQNNDFTLQLIGPLNIGSMRIIKQHQLTTFIQGDRRIESSNAEQLLSEQTNLPLPLNSLSFWLVGKPSPNWPFKLKDMNNDKIGFTQQGWQVQYTEFMPNQPHRLPKKIVAQYERLKLRVAIHQWQLNGGSEQP